jgi:hypothetical protein
MLGAILKEFKIGKICTPLPLSSDLKLRLAKHGIRMQGRGFGLTVAQIRILAQTHGNTERLNPETNL